MFRSSLFLGLGCLAIMLSSSNLIVFQLRSFQVFEVLLLLSVLSLYVYFDPGVSTDDDGEDGDAGEDDGESRDEL